MQSKVRIVYVITARGTKKYWNRVGVAFVNNDGSLNVRLDAVPVTGEFHIRDMPIREESAESGRTAELNPSDHPAGPMAPVTQSELVPTAVPN